MKKFHLNRLGLLILISCVAAATVWFDFQKWLPSSRQDFEQCSAMAEKTASSGDQRTTLLAECDKQFVARRKPGGGYTYYDFLQNRHFDIAGPNPTKEEQKYFDEQYTFYLKALKQEADAASLAEQKNLKAQPEVKDDSVVASISPPGPPLVITPSTIPIPRARSSVIPPDGVCEDSSPSCSWAKFAAGLKKFFQSNADVNRH